MICNSCQSDELRRILQHGPPHVLISDRGRHFTADVVKELLHLSDSQFCHSVPYHKQINGLTERTIRTLTNMNAMHVASDHNWDDIWPFITHAYHTAKHETMGYSPFYPVDARVPLTTSTPSSFTTRPAYQTPCALLKKLGNSLVSIYWPLSKTLCVAEEARKLTSLHILPSQDRSKLCYDSRHQKIRTRGETWFCSGHLSDSMDCARNCCHIKSAHSWSLTDLVV